MAESRCGLPLAAELQVSDLVYLRCVILCHVQQTEASLSYGSAGLGRRCARGWARVLTHL